MAGLAGEGNFAVEVGLKQKKYMCKRTIWQHVCSFFTNGWTCLSLAIVSVVVCVCHEMDWVIFRCGSPAYVRLYNEFVVTLAYGYIAAAMFYFMVTYCPHRIRQEKMKAFVCYALFSLCDLLRRSKELVVNPFDISGNNGRILEDKKAYADFFARKNMNDAHPFSKEKTIVECLERNRIQMTELASKLLTIRGYLQEDEFDFVLSILNSTFVCEGIVPDEEVYRETQSQKKVGSELYDLYEKARGVLVKYM